MRPAIASLAIAVLAVGGHATIRAEAAIAPVETREPVPSVVITRETTTTTKATTTTAPAPTTTVTLPAEPEPAGIDDARCPEMWSTALAVGWDEVDLLRLDVIVWAESNCRTDVVSSTSDYGLTQINWAAHGSRLKSQGVTREMLLDPWINLAQALWIADYAEEHYGCRWQPWYMSGEWC